MEQGKGTKKKKKNPTSFILLRSPRVVFQRERERKKNSPVATGGGEALRLNKYING